MTRFAFFSMMSGDYDGGHMWGGGGWSWLAMTMMMVIAIALVGLVVWAIVRSTRPHQASGLEHARSILAERLARGEISPEEYRERLQHL